MAEGVAEWGAGGVDPRWGDELGGAVGDVDFPCGVVDEAVVLFAEEDQVS